MRLSQHFTLEEFSKSSTAQSLNIDNTIPPQYVNNIIDLVKFVLEPARVKFNHPIYITSGYRCPKLNKAVGGSSKSQHLLGQAADLQTKDTKSLKSLFDCIRTLGNFDQLLFERNSKGSQWIHVSFNKDNNRNMVIDNYRVK